MSDDWDEIRRQMLGYYAPDLTTSERYDSPLDLARALDPSIVRTPALELINTALVDLMDTPDGRLIISMPPQEGKTTLVKALVEWVLRDTPDTRAAVTTNDAGLARKMGRAVRDDIRDHASVLGLRLRRDVAAQAEFQILGRRGGVYAVGIGGGLTGRPVDLLVIDDPVKNRKQADSETYRNMTFDWWTDVASTRLAPGAPVVLVLTRWHQDDLAGRLTTGEDADRWTVLNIPAQADHNPEKGETDPLDREFGEYLESARGRSVEQWAAIKVQAGSRTWNALYQGRPSPAEGGMFKRDKWRYYSQPLWLERPDGTRFCTHFDDMLASWDMTFKDTDGTDFVVGQVWMRRGADAFLLDQVRARMSFVETCHQFRVFSARWPQALMKLVEDKANGPAVISALARIVPGIIPEEPHGSKVARAAAVSPLQEAGNVWLPAPEIDGCAWVGDFVEEHAAFPTGTHDDMVDADSQGLNRLILQPLLTGETLVTEDDLDDELAEFSISPY